MKKEKKTVIILVILLTIAIIYIVSSWYTQAQEKKQTELLQQGIQVGYQQAVTQLIQQVATCQQVPVVFQNQTINIIAVECLQQG